MASFHLSWICSSCASSSLTAMRWVADHPSTRSSSSSYYSSCSSRVSAYTEDFERVRAHHDTAALAKVMRKPKVWVELLFGEARQWYGLEQFRLRGLDKVNAEALVIAAGQNLKRLLSWRGWC